jgi:hypothetical protein
MMMVTAGSSLEIRVAQFNIVAHVHSPLFFGEDHSSARVESGTSGA